MSVIRIRQPGQAPRDIDLGPSNPRSYQSGYIIRQASVVGQMRPILTAGVTFDGANGQKRRHAMRDASAAHWERRYSIHPENRVVRPTRAQAEGRG